MKTEYILEISIVMLITTLVITYTRFTRAQKTNKALIDSIKTNKVILTNAQVKAEKSSDELEKFKSYHDTAELKYKDYISLFVGAKIKVYAQGQFYTDYSFYNNRFYAKVFKNTRNTKAESIPFIELPNNNKLVINIYKLNLSIKQNPFQDVEVLIKNATTTKVAVIDELENKILKFYAR